MRRFQTKTQTTMASATPTGDPWLLTPGPLTTSRDVKQAMLHDYGSRDHHLISINKLMLERLVAIVHGEDSHVCVPMQGSGTFAVEAMIGSFVPDSGKLLVLINGAYGRRIAKIAEYYGIALATIEAPEDQPIDPEAVELQLNGDKSITHVAAIHCETTSGILNPLAQISKVVARCGRALLIDAMSAFGAIELDSRAIRFDAAVASSNKCLEGTPGLGFCIARTGALEQTAGNARSLSLDLHDQWTVMQASGQWRFTPPVHTIVAFDKALDEFDAEGGVAGRGRRYGENCRILVAGMRKLGFHALLPDALQAPIIVTFLMPKDPRFKFQSFYDRLRERGYVIYPGKLTVADTFRVGCIGRLGSQQIEGALGAIETTLAELGVSDCAPAEA